MEPSVRADKTETADCLFGFRSSNVKICKSGEFIILMILFLGRKRLWNFQRPTNHRFHGVLSEGHGQALSRAFLWCSTTRVLMSWNAPDPFTHKPLWIPACGFLLVRHPKVVYELLKGTTTDFLYVLNIIALNTNGQQQGDLTEFVQPFLLLF